MKYKLLTVVLIALISCGYQFSGSKSKIGEKYTNVHVKIGENLTNDVDLELKIIDTITSLVNRYQDVEFVNDERQADAIILVYLKKLDSVYGALGKTGTFDIDEYRILTYSVELVDASGKKIWESGDQRVSSFSAVSLAAFDESGVDAISKGYLNRDLRSARDVSSIDTEQTNLLFAHQIADSLESAIFERHF